MEKENKRLWCLMDSGSRKNIKRDTKEKKISHIEIVIEILRKEINASYTVENAVIIPFFFMLIITFMSVSIYIHDRIVLKNALEQAAIEYEYRSINSWSSVSESGSDSNNDDKEKFCSDVKKYVETKTLFLNNISINISQKDNNVKVIGKAEFPIASMYVSKSINASVMVSVNNPEKWIWITNALKEAIQ